jgi:hypothetical protein
MANRGDGQILPPQDNRRERISYNRSSVVRDMGTSKEFFMEHRCLVAGKHFKALGRREFLLSGSEFL